MTIEPTAHRSTRKGAARKAGRHERGRPIELGSRRLDFEEFLELVPDAIVLADRSGSIAHANSAAEELFGWSHGELTGRPVEALIPTRLLTLHVAHRERYLQDPRRRPMGIGLELKGRRRDGSEFPAEISLAPVHSEDGMLVAAAVRDVSERERAESARRELEDEARAERELSSRRMEGIGAIAGGVAHDFNNLLTVVRESAALALLRATDGETRELLEEIMRAVQHGSDLTGQLLAFGRSAEAEEERTDVNAVIATLERLLRRTIGSRNRLEVKTAPGLPMVAAERAHIEQILLNLVINARDAMPGGGAITLATSRSESRVTLTVRDEGHGMEPAVAERATDPFFTTKPEGEGTGLGLATVDGIVSRLDGSLTLETAPGSGTTVHVHIPAAPPRTRAWA